MSDEILILECDLDNRFKVYYDRNDDRYNAKFYDGEIVYGCWSYRDVLNWLVRHFYLSQEKYESEM